jgi:uncharacterized protein (TIGR03000 family)
MSLYRFAATRLVGLAVVALLLTGKTVTAEQSQAGPSEPDQAVHFYIMAPADAEVWFDGAKTAQTGSYRKFVSPPLRPGHHYSYDVRIRWKDEGREVDRTRHVSCYAGDHINLNFMPDHVQAHYSYYEQRPWPYTPSFSTVSFSPGSEYASPGRVRSLRSRDPLRVSGNLRGFIPSN